MIYRAAGQPLRVEADDAWAARVTAALFAEWYLESESETAAAPLSAPAMIVRSEAPVPRIPAGLPDFAIAGGGRCHTDGDISYIDIDGSVVVIGGPGPSGVEVWLNGPLAQDSPALTRLVSYGLSAALRRRGLFELHSAALVDPQSGAGVLIIGPSGSGKSTQTVHLAAAGWPFLTDDVLLLGEMAAGIQAWPLRRSFAITAETFAASRFLQARAAFDPLAVQADDKQLFAPHGVFTAGFRDTCMPGTLVFPALSGGSRSHVSRLSAGDAMARLIRMSPWSCYDRATAAAHLGILSALAQQAKAYALAAGTDLLDADASTDLIAGCAAGAWA